MENINKNIIMQAGAAVANATNKAAGLSASTPEPGSIISAIQLVNGGRTIGPDALAHFTESVRNKLLSLLVNMEPIQSGSGTPSPDNVRPFSGRTGLYIYVSPTPNAADATTYTVDWTDEAGTVYGGTLDVVTGVLTVDRAYALLDDPDKWVSTTGTVDFRYDVNFSDRKLYNDSYSGLLCSVMPVNSENQNFTARWTAVTSKTFGVKATSPALSIDVFKNLSSNGEFAISYELATPLTYQLTGTDIVTLVGDNYIWSDSGDVTITE